MFFRTRKLGFVTREKSKKNNHNTIFEKTRVSENVFAFLVFFLRISMETKLALPKVEDESEETIVYLGDRKPVVLRTTNQKNKGNEKTGGRPKQNNKKAEGERWKFFFLKYFIECFSFISLIIYK